MSNLQIKSDEKASHANVLLVGNPNVGKSLIFNQLTGSRQKIANFPGITLSHKSGSYNHSEKNIELHDLPGIYGFNSGNYEENVAHNFVINHPHDLIINIADARKLERSLFLTLQLREMQRNMILVLTFKDKIEQRAMQIDIKNLTEILGIPVLMISSQDKSDIEILKNQIHQLIFNQPSTIRYPSLQLDRYKELIEYIVEELENTVVIYTDNILKTVPIKWIVISVLMNTRASETLWPFWIVNKTQNIIDEKMLDRKQTSMDLINYHYEKISEIVSEVIDPTSLKNNFNSYSDKIDKVLLEPKLGLPIFAILMWSVFRITFDISTPFSDSIAVFSESLAEYTKETIGNKLIASFFADALIGGIGFILVFIPQITFLFFFIGVLEHTGYLSRVVFVTDRFLNKIGISGTSIAPMLLGFGCNVPAIMATKSTRDINERTAMILVNPFMSCSARLPVYVIIAGALFPDNAGLIIALLYFSGIAIAILILYILRKTILKGETAYLLMELPELTLPTMRTTLSRVYLQVRKFVENAASWMAIGLIVMWILSITGPSGYIGPEALDSSELLKKTWIFQIGNIFQPFFGVFGWDNRLIVSLIFGFVAKEIVISSFGLIYGVEGNASSLELIIASQFTLASGLAYLFFVLLYTPCIGTYFAIKQEIGSKWANVSVITGLIIAYGISLIALSVGNLIW